MAHAGCAFRVGVPAPWRASVAHLCPAGSTSSSPALARTGPGPGEPRVPESQRAPSRVRSSPVEHMSARCCAPRSRATSTASAWWPSCRPAPRAPSRNASSSSPRGPPTSRSSPPPWPPSALASAAAGATTGAVTVATARVAATVAEAASARTRVTTGRRGRHRRPYRRSPSACAPARPTAPPFSTRWRRSSAPSSSSCWPAASRRSGRRSTSRTSSSAPRASLRSSPMPSYGSRKSCARARKPPCGATAPRRRQRSSTTSICATCGRWSTPQATPGATTRPGRSPRSCARRSPLASRRSTPPG